MDLNRSGQTRPTVPVGTAAALPKQSALVSRDWRQGKIYKIAFLALLVSATILFIAVIFFLAFGRTIDKEAKLVDKGMYQAVFVNVNGTNGGQVYFGKITDLTAKYIRLEKVFYIQNQASSDNASSAYNLVKLGCELHGPSDMMVINRDQVFFWENLKDDGQVAQKAAEFWKQNPNGQKCNTTNSNSTQQSSGTTQNAGQSTTPTSTTTTPTPTTNTTKKQ
jgi:hypothetical protein